MGNENIINLHQANFISFQPPLRRFCHVYIISISWLYHDYLIFIPCSFIYRFPKREWCVLFLSLITPFISCLIPFLQNALLFNFRLRKVPWQLSTWNFAGDIIGNIVQNIFNRKLSSPFYGKLFLYWILNSNTLPSRQFIYFTSNDMLCNMKTLLRILRGKENVNEKQRKYK